MSEVGRPSLLTPQVIEILKECLEGCEWLDAACAEAGITMSTFNRWCRKAEVEIDRRDRGEGPDSSKDLLVHFRVTVARARAQAERSMLSAIKADINGEVNPRSKQRPNGALALAWLKQARPDTWGGRKSDTKDDAGYDRALAVREAQRLLGTEEPPVIDLPEKSLDDD